MKKTLLTAASLLVAASVALAQGKDALPFTRIDVNPALSGMAGASIASADEMAWSGFRNAATLPFSEKNFDAGIGYQLWSPSAAKSNNINVGVAYKFSPKMGLSLGFTNQSGNAYNVVSDDGEVTGTFSPNDMAVALGLGFGLGEHVSLGLNARYAHQTLAQGVAYSGISADAFLLFRLGESFDLTAGVSTLGNSIESTTKKKFAQPAYATVGAEFRILDGLKVDAAGEYYFSKNFAAAVGASYCSADMIYLRAGYRYASAACVLPSHLAVGAGVKFGGIRVDVSYLTASPILGNTLSVGVNFGI